MRKWMLALAAVAGVVFVGLTIALEIQVSGGNAAGPTATRARADLAFGTAVDRRVPAAKLVDASGKPTSLRRFRGKWVVIAPAMTLCTQVCPMTTAALMRLQRLMAAAGAGRHFAAVELTVDPWRDSPHRLRAYRRMTGADFPMLTGSVGTVRRLWRFFGVNFERTPQGKPPARDWLTGKPERFDVEHTDGAFIIDPSGHERLAISGMPAVGGRIEPALKQLLNTEGRENLRHPEPGWSAVAMAKELEKLMGLEGGNGAAAGGAAKEGAAAGRVGSTGSGLRAEASLEEGLEAVRGRPAVVNVWASWCPPCREEMPLLATAERRFGSRIAFLGADLEDNAESARGFLHRVGVDYPSYPADTSEVTGLLGPAQGTPLTFYLDGAGEVVDEHVGAYRSAAELDADLLRHSSPG